jgi:hypothetical protein
MFFKNLEIVLTLQILICDKILSCAQAHNTGG